MQDMHDKTSEEIPFYKQQKYMRQYKIIEHETFH